LAHDGSRAESRLGRAVAVCSALAVPEFVKRLTIHFVSLQCCDMLHIKSYYNVTLACDDSRRGQHGTATAKLNAIAELLAKPEPTGVTAELAELFSAQVGKQHCCNRGRLLQS